VDQASSTVFATHLYGRDRVCHPHTFTLLPQPPIQKKGHA
jgi:hypothetical protein